ncbi:hypothetical protein [Mastigocoleus testarum]|uniref:Effector-associated domain-containing protein n=1 Tax=Mastigocoleus testarum BC008 TaxID=371196 RepID=A0A0V7ZKT0_9CYAN|nr:hypothetical protein [Mastigocoleus testarum]KST65080.1 hypothetical protein BC008_19985 [Mastigocoleus testarum BC008]
MANSNNPNDIIKRILNGIQTDDDVEALRQLLLAGDRAATPEEYRQVLQQLSKYNVNITEAKEIHIGDRNYYSWNEEALSALVHMIRFHQSDDVDTANLLVTKLNNARLQGEEGDRKTGSFYTYNVWLEDVCLEKSNDSTENNCCTQQYTIKGKWDSKVYKEVNMFGLRVDKPWGLKKKPHGNFTVTVEILNGRATQVKVDVVRYDDSANNYAADKAKQLINSKIRVVLQKLEMMR